MTTKKTLMWIQRLVWIYIYGGLLAVVLGVFLARTAMTLARAVQGVGALFVRFRPCLCSRARGFLCGDACCAGFGMARH